MYNGVEEMKLKTFLGVSAIVLGLFGISMIFNSAGMAKGFGLELNDLGRVLFRDLGTTLLGVAAINWLSRGIEDSKALKVVITGNLVTQALGVVVNVANITQGYIGASAWGGVILHAVLAGGFAYYYIQLQKPAASR
jgi:hypothetical protein